MRSVISFSVGILLTATAACGGEVDYLRQVKPILRERCFACHGALTQEAGLRLDAGALIRRGGDSGPAVQPGRPQKSLLIERVTAEDEWIRMPLDAKPLEPEQIAVLTAWIKQGASYPADDQPEVDPREHWAFKQPVRPQIPLVRNPAWADNPIDAFISAEHDAQGLKPVAAADKGTLLRRLYVDLIGLPPSRGELLAFLADRSPYAVEKVVDQLLSSPQYGERWGRHWMDVWRYSDWYGRRSVNDVRNSYPHIWRWRDWIIQSLNADKGYDRMVMEMLAADEIAPEDDRAVVATGFIVRNWYSLNYDLWMKDLVEHTSKAFLAIRMNCAHCHDHKYDPITQREYFRFRAFFEPLEFRHDRVPGGPALGKYKKYVPGSGAALKPIEAGLARVFDAEPDAETYMYRLGDARDRFEDEPPVTPAAPAILGGDAIEFEPVELPPVAYYPGLKPFVQREELARCERAVEKAEAELAQARERSAAIQTAQSTGREQRTTTAATAAVGSAAADEYAENNDNTTTNPPVEAPRADQLLIRAAETRLEAARARQQSLAARIAADKVKYTDEPGDVERLARDAARLQRQAECASCRHDLAAAEHARAVAKDEKARQRAETQIAEAREALETARKSLEEQSSEYTPLGPIYPARSSGRRTALARWIANRDNPLTARVAVNHIWMRHFGRPLVDSVYDFGRGGERPSHPRLLDWLAVELMESNWSMKRLHRLIVTSQTYRLCSDPADAGESNMSVDPENRYWWRREPLRMEAEVIRDGMLALSGELDRKLGGPEIENKHESDSGRRSLYFTTYPEAGGTMPFLQMFDAADPCQCYRRTETILPQQALAMTNSELALQLSRLMARRLTATSVDDVNARKRSETEFVETVFEHLLSRSPSGEERQISREFLDRQRALFSGIDANMDAETEKGSGSRSAVPPSDDPATRARESFVRALLSHNEFVTIR